VNAATAAAALLALALGGAPADVPLAPLAPRVPRKLLRPPPPRSLPAPQAPGGHGDATRCELCHTESGWSSAAFPHDGTGFPLTGRHQGVSCRRCHVLSLSASIPRACGGCHRDAHGGEFGALCDGCHQAAGWATTFTAEAHRRTNFPLAGRHALVPCQECHADARARGFTRATTPCAGCHLQDYQRAAATGLDHQAAGFSTDCRQCHGPWRFRQASFPGHDLCFQLGRGPHAGISCLGCHSSLPAAVATGACSTGTAACSACHTHGCTTADRQHTGVPGYQCKDLKCYSCHRFAAGG